MAKEKANKTGYIIGAVIIVLLVVIIGMMMSNSNNSNNSQNTNTNNQVQQPTSSNIYTEVESGGDFLEITKECFWSGTELRCSGNVKDIETKPHTTDDIYIGVIAFDNNDKCGYCNDKINLGEFSEGKTKTYSLSCDVGKKTDILASIAVTGGAARIYNGCE